MAQKSTNECRATTTTITTTTTTTTNGATAKGTRRKTASKFMKFSSTFLTTTNALKTQRAVGDEKTFVK